jgi:hypothetical protein
LVNGAAYFEQQRGDGGIAERLGRLLTYADENTGVDANAGTAAAMQLAVLNLVYDNEWSVSEPGLFRDSSVYATEASALLAGAQTVTSSRYDVFALENKGTQDQLAWSRRALDESAVTQAVPEPAGWALAGTALLGMLMLSRRRGS